MQINSLNKFGKSEASSVTSKNDEVNNIAVSQHEKSILDLSYSHKTTFDVGKVVPVFQSQVYPGDSFDIDVSCLIRMSMPSAPVMDSPRFDFNLFFIPWEQVWDNFNSLIGESYEGGSPVIVESVPVINYNSSITYGPNDLASHMEIPINVDMSTTGINISALPFKAYIKVWNEWFRDENLQSKVDWTNQENNDNDVMVSNFINQPAELSTQIGQGLLSSNRLKDYFSSCLPFVQKGEPVSVGAITADMLNQFLQDVTINNAVIDNTPYDNAGINNTFSMNWYQNQSGDYISWNGVNDSNNYWTGTPFFGFANNENSTQKSSSLSSNTVVTNDQYGPGPYNPLFNSLTVKSADFSYSGTAGLGTFDITALRAALVQQHQRELDARAGTRYYEKLLSYWGVETDPLKIGRTLMIGGYHDSININNVVQSAPATGAQANSPLGTLGALSVTASRSPNKFHFAASQYGIILGLVTVRTNLSYSQGLPRLFTTLKNTDFYNPTFNGISEQPIYKYELFLSNNSANNLSVFGYNQPFAHLKYKPNVCSGYLSCNATDTFYQLYSYQNNLSSSPTLSNEWTYYPNSALENTLLLDSSNSKELINDFMGDFYFNVKVSRQIPAYSVPGVNKV